MTERPAICFFYKTAVTIRLLLRYIYMSGSSGVANGVTYCDTMYDFSASVVIHRKNIHIFRCGTAANIDVNFYLAKHLFSFYSFF